MNKTIHITYSWNITQKEWNEGKEFWVSVLKEKAKYDPINMFHMLNNIKWPDAKVEIT